MEGMSTEGPAARPEAGAQAMVLLLQATAAADQEASIAVLHQEPLRAQILSEC